PLVPATGHAQKVCNGVHVRLPGARNPYMAYPFAMHKDGLPWDVRISNLALWARSVSCARTVAAQDTACTHCTSVLSNPILLNILKRMEHGVPAKANHAYHGPEGMIWHLRQKSKAMTSMRRNAWNMTKKLARRARTLDEHKK
ncbi:hypothetical protein EXIGLDRAFT_569524, partial [Exidia glandulosa HHB12029]